MMGNKGQFLPGKKTKEFEIKRISGMLGHVVSEETRKKIGEANKISLLGNIPWNKGKKGIQKGWNKGMKYANKKRLDLIKKKEYRRLHIWVEKKKGKPDNCSFCKKTGIKFQWANISGKYKKIINDWISLCVSCHQKYDNQKRNVN